MYLKCLLFLLFLPFFSDQDQWQLKKSGDGIHVYVAPKPGSKFKQFKAEMEVNVPVEVVKSILIDVNKMPEWYDKISNVKIIHRLSPTEGVYRVDFDFPALVSDRFTVLNSKLTEDPNTRAITVLTQYFPKHQEKDSDKVLVNVIESKWVLTPISATKTKVVHIGHMEPNGSLPSWLINSNLINGPYKTFANLKARL